MVEDLWQFQYMASTTAQVWLRNKKSQSLKIRQKSKKKVLKIGYYSDFFGPESMARLLNGERIQYQEKSR